MADRSAKLQMRSRKRAHPPIFSGTAKTCDDRNSDYLCPICFDIINEPHMTKCGHSFCYSCITRALEMNSRCPKCNYVVDKMDQIFPNILLNELILKEKQKQSEKRAKLDATKSMNDYLQYEPGKSEMYEFLSSTSDSLGLNDINAMLDVLVRKKQQIEADCREAQNQLLKEFLTQMRKRKQDQLEQLQQEIRVIDGDANIVESYLQNHKLAHNKVFNVDETKLSNGPNGEASISKSASTTSNTFVQDGFNTSRMSERNRWLCSSMAVRRKHVAQHFDDLEHCYLTTRLKDLQSNQNSVQGIQEFTQCLSKFTQYSSIRPLATLSYASDMYNTSSIVSSIEFDRDCDYFAIAGVTKKIKVFEYNVVIQDVVDIHYPVVEMLCNSKISCVSWSSYHKGQMASSDYEGTVTIWDAFTGTSVKSFQEHEKRCWSVDFNKQDTQLLASGSDDAKVKLWSTNSEHSVASLEAKANVCCVKFNPNSRYHLAFGSADHFVHYYDLRSPKEPVCVFKGHRKAVSYAKFVSSEEIVSASTDSQLKLWNISQNNCLRTFRGHSNEKNFVGLATDGDYIACGSENNSLYIYYKGLSKNLLTFKFDTVGGVLEKDKRDEDTSEFVSAVSWRADSNVVVAANSQGTIKLLELV